MKRSTAFRGVALVTLAQFLSLACGSKAGPVHPAGGGGPTGGRPPLQLTDTNPGLTMRLSDGRQGPSAVDHSALAKATPVSDADLAAILARVPALEADAGDTTAFALRDRSTPPPRTGATIKGAFPPPVGSGPPPAAGSKDLTVLRWAPEGDVPVAPSLQVTFSQPMIAVTSQDDASATTPVKLTPTPPGHWRWLGTRTITFDPDVRFPQATTYTVEVPAGTRDAAGDALAAGKTFSFTTPSPRVQVSWPEGSPQHLDTPMFILFDQKIDPEAVLATIHVRAAGKEYPVRLLTADEVAKHDTVAGLVASAKANQQDGRWLAFRATDAFPTETSVAVTVGPATPSAEGPNPTKDAQSFSFETYAPLKIVDAECGWGECRPGEPFRLQFNNPLDEDRWDDGQVTVTPALDARVSVSGQYVNLNGPTQAMTTYQLRVSGGVVDTFGQTLGKDATYTFKVGASYPNFYGPNGLVALDPAGKKPTLDVFSSNYDGVKVQLYKVSPSDWEAYTNYLQHQWERVKPSLPGTRVVDTVQKVDGPREQLVETHIDLAPALAANGLGHAIAVVEPSPWTESYDPPRLVTWVQSTRLSVDAAVDADDLYAWVNRLADGAPVAGAKLELRPYGVTGTTAADGTTKLPLAAARPGANLLVARSGDDVAFIPDDSSIYGGEGQWARRTADDSLAWYVTDDRQMYKPGEDVHVKGWIRVHEGKKGGDLAGIAGAVTGVHYKVVDPLGNQLFEGTAPLSALGGFDLAFTLPKTPNLGEASVQLESVGHLSGSAWHGFQIQEFRRPEYEVSVQASQGPQMIGGSADVTVNASYFAGGGLQDAEVSWALTATPTTFTPPNRDDYVFGVWVPWWGWGRNWWDDGSDYKPPQTWSHTAKTDATGAHVLHLDFLGVNPPGPMSVTANATVTDVNRQGWAASTELLVHPAAVYVGLKTARPFVDKGKPIDLDALAVDLDGKAVAGRPIAIHAARLDYEYSHGKYSEVEADPQDCALTSGTDALPCSFATKEGGQYRITALVTDEQGRANRTELTVWVSGGETPPAREVSQEAVTIIPSAKEFAPGDTAELLIQAPFYPAEGVLSTRRSGVVSSSRFTMTGPTQTVKVPIMDGYTPNLEVQVDLVGAAPRVGADGKPDASLPKRPAYAVGTIDLSIPPRRRTLSVEIAPAAAKVAPGERTRLDVRVKDASGKPVEGAEIAVLAVDEAVLSLTGYKFPDPVELFYQQREAGASDHHLRGFVHLARPDSAVVTATGDTTKNMVFTAAIAPEEAEAGLPMTEAPPPPPAPPGMPMPKKPSPDKDADGLADVADASHGGAGGPAIAVRTNFNPLAAFAPSVRSGGDGKASVELTVPDNLTRYRLIAIAVAGDKEFGKGESAMTARLPVMVRPSPPRFLNFGDTFQLPVVVQNQTDAALDVTVGVRATNASLTDGGGRKVTVPANDRVEVRFPAAAELAGTARFQIVASSSAGGDAAEVALPVWTPATTEAFATYGQLDSGAIHQPVALPGKVVTSFGELDVETSSTQLQALTDAFLYLVTYPFECAEQRASRIAAIAALRDVLTAFKAKDLPSPSALEARVADDLERLYAMQNDDGGFAFWERGFDSWPFLTVHVTNAMLRVKAKGFPVEAAPLASALAYLKDIEHRYPAWYGPEIRRAITSYALYTRMLAGDRDIAAAQRLIREAGGADKLSMETAGWLLGVLAAQPSAAADRKALLRAIENHAVETAGQANFTTSYDDGGYLLLASDRRVDGIILESLIAEQKTHDLIPKVVAGLLAHRTAGRWDNTQDNVFVLQALDLYFHEYEKATPDFVAKVWLGDGYAGDHAFKGRTTERFQIAVPMQTVADKAAKGPTDLVIAKDGAGRLYYRIGMTYAPASLSLAAADDGFAVSRRYEAVDDPGDVVRLPDGTWKIKAGAKVRVRLAMVAENRRYHVALVDPLPAGLEAMNPALAVTGPIPQAPSAQKSPYWWWSQTWYEHQNLRDERVEAFTSLLWEGVHEYTYVARATTPGTFVVPPTKAEEMYAPETFGRSASDKVIVE
ncbi:MAG TPA: Ig-like domain-containing protein [Kofleriaceae bacterium]|nr:Ig-like domain-containing protein [Kofleriaceae bacterium]